MENVNGGRELASKNHSILNCGFSNAIPGIQLTVPSGTRKRPSLSFTVSLSLPLSGLSSGSGVGPNASP